MAGNIPGAMAAISTSTRPSETLAAIMMSSAATGASARSEALRRAKLTVAAVLEMSPPITPPTSVPARAPRSL